MSLEIPSESGHFSQRNVHPTSDHTVLKVRARVLLGSGNGIGQEFCVAPDKHWLSRGEAQRSCTWTPLRGSGSRPSVDF